MIGMEKREQLFRLLQQRMFDIQSKKGRDYGEESDGLRNLRRRGRTGIVARMGDKLTRLENLITSGREPQVSDETIEDTLLDLANYCLLLIILMWDEDNKIDRISGISTPNFLQLRPLIVRRIDEKHDVRAELKDGFVSLRLYKTTNNQPIPEEEPVILFRGRDKLALPMLEFYCDLCKKDGATDYQLESMDTMIRRFIDFKLNNPETMKQPGSTLGK